MGDAQDPGAGFRRRARTGGVPVLLDEVVALLREQPALWIPVALRAGLLGGLALLWLVLHAGAFTGADADLPVAVASVPASVLLVLAWLWRSVGHGEAARRTVAWLAPSALSPGSGGRTVDHVILALCGGSLIAVGAAAWLLPALLVLGSLMPLPALVAVEGRDAPSAVQRLLSLPAGAVGRGILAVGLMLALFVALWGNVVVGVQLAVYGLDALAGIQLAGALRWVSIDEPAFLLACAVVVAVILDPLWALLRAALYLKLRLDETGLDLQERWQQIRSGATALLVLLLVAPSAWAQQPIDMEPLPVEPQSVSLEDHALCLEQARQSLEQAQQVYAEAEWAALDAPRQLIGSCFTGPVELPDGRLERFEGTALVGALPTALHDENTAATVERVVGRVARSRDLAEALAHGAGDAGFDPELAVITELSEGSYDVPEMQVHSQPLKARIRAFVEDLLRRLSELIRGEQPEEVSPPEWDLPLWGGRELAWALTVLTALLLAGLALGVALRRLQSGSGGEARPATRPAEDARTNSPEGWLAEADACWAEGAGREAVRLLYLGVLAALDRRAEVDYRPERSNGELLRSFRGDPPRRRGFAHLTTRVEWHWYGGVEPDEEGWRALRGDAEPLWRDRSDA